MNRASLDRGFGRCIVLRKYGTSLKKYANRTQVRLDHAACPLHLGCPQCLPAGGSQQLYAPLFVLSHFVTMKINQSAWACTFATSSCQDRIVLPAAAAGGGAARPGKFRILDRDGIAAAGEVLSQGGCLKQLHGSLVTLAGCCCW